MKKEIDKSSFFNITYGLFVVSARSGAKDNGCIINTLCQVAENPLLVSVSLNKKNYTNRLIQETGIFNASFINESADFALFKRFGFSSGADTDKFEGFSNIARADNGVLYITEQCNTYISAKVKQTIDLGSHWLYIAEVTDAEKLNNIRSCSYNFYQSNIKQKPAVSEKKTGWVCKICGYVYEGENLPENYECPICKHGPEVFEKLT